MTDILEICCGLDVHKDTVVACLLKGSTYDSPSKEIRTFSTLLPGLEELKTWLEEEQCHHVAMKRTGVYWQPVNTILENAFDGNISILVTNGGHMKNVPGKKTHIKDSEWVAALLRAGLLRGSFTPPADVRELRELTRYGSSITGEIAVHKKRVEKYLQSCGFKLSSFLTDIFGLTGRTIIDYLSEHGQISPDTVQLYVKDRAKIKTDDIKIAVNGTMTKHQREFLNMLLKHLDESTKHLREVDLKIEAALESFRTQLHQLDGIPGEDIVAAEAIIAEIGIDMSNFKTSDHICSLTGLAPGNNESVGMKKVHG